MKLKDFSHYRSKKQVASAQPAIRLMTEDDVTDVYSLFSEYAADQFGENYSYDRWGPGVPAPYGDLEEARTQTIDPSLAVQSRLRALLNGSRGFVLVASDQERLIGFIATSLLPASPLEDELVGCVDDLYVVPGRRREGIACSLVSHASRLLRRSGALMFRVEIAHDALAARRFWDRQPDWTNQVRTYHYYL